MLKRIAHVLNKKIAGYRFGEIFSQNKDELIIGLFDSQNSFYIKADLSGQFSCLSFPDDFARARKNSVNLFEQLINRKITRVEVGKNDRSLKIIIELHTLVFKLYGNRSNIILFEGDQAAAIFKQKFNADLALSLPSDFDKELDFSIENFATHRENLSKFIPTLGKEDLKNIEQTLPSKGNTEDDYHQFMTFLKRMVEGPVYVNFDGSLPKLMLYKFGSDLKTIDNPIDALTIFYHEYIRRFHLEVKKKELLSEKKKQIKKINNYLAKTKGKLEEINQRIAYQQIGDIIMASLHAIKPGASEAELFNFYTNQNILIKLKKELSPQKNAENYYRKSKNQKIEIGKLKANVKAQENRLRSLESEVEQIVSEDEIKNLKQFDRKSNSISTQKELPYHIFNDGEYQILIGKNAKKNDELTFKIATKNDLWLHVKDAPGSHVIIRQIPGRNIGAPTLEKAAALAAWYSKRKTEGTVPVSYTERKYVRKSKGLLPGQVIVEREKTILVEPKNWLSKN